MKDQTPCAFCNQAPEKPFSIWIGDKLVNLCVAKLHDAYLRVGSQQAVMVSKARKAGISGKW